jgi:hypothetical protein
MMEEEVNDVAWGNLLSGDIDSNEPTRILHLLDWAGSSSLTEWFEHEKPQSVLAPAWLTLAHPKECQDTLKGLVFLSITNEDCLVKSLVQKKLFGYMARLCKQASQ